MELFNRRHQMTANVDLMPNRYALQAEATLADGRRLSLRIEPNHAWVDDQGYIRLFTIFWNDGTSTNLKLLPRHTEAWQIVEEIASFLSIYGLTRAAGAVGRILSKGGKMVPSLAVFLANTHGTSLVLRNIFSRAEIRDSAYYSLETGELVFTHPIRVN
jgi:hypothetical protein